MILCLVFYQDFKRGKKMLQNKCNGCCFSEFGRRVKDNGNGTDHGTAAPMFYIIEWNNKGTVLGNNPNLADLDNGDWKYETGF